MSANREKTSAIRWRYQSENLIEKGAVQEINFVRFDDRSWLQCAKVCAEQNGRLGVARKDR
jgi:hypothetical protein